MAIESSDNWIRGKSVRDPHVLSKLRATLEDSPVIVEHRFYRAGRSPDRLVFEDFGDLEAYLTSKVAPGDSFWFWRFDHCCTDGNALEIAKVPDDRGLVPEGGAY